METHLPTPEEKEHILSLLTQEGFDYRSLDEHQKKLVDTLLIFRKVDVLLDYLDHKYQKKTPPLSKMMTIIFARLTMTGGFSEKDNIILLLREKREVLEHEVGHFMDALEGKEIPQAQKDEGMRKRKVEFAAMLTILLSIIIFLFLVYSNQLEVTSCFNVLMLAALGVVVSLYNTYRYKQIEYEASAEQHFQ